MRRGVEEFSAAIQGQRLYRKDVDGPAGAGDGRVGEVDLFFGHHGPAAS